MPVMPMQCPFERICDDAPSHVRVPGVSDLGSGCEHERCGTGGDGRMAGEVLHEDRAQLDPQILDRHRAISTLMEELEAIDWYDQRIKASTNAELQAVLQHNRNEEKEHASMLLEWLRRHDEEFTTHLRTYLFTT